MGKTAGQKVCAYVLGHPIAHSLSPALHKAAYEVLTEDIDYTRRDTLPEDLPDILAEADSGRTICGLSVTMPLKTAIIPYLQGTSDLAQITGAVNTVYWRTPENQPSSGAQSPVPYGHNTDVGGIVNALLHAGLDVSVQASNASPAILGAGATAVSALAALHYLGYQKVTVYARSMHKLANVREAAQRLDLELDAYPLAQFAQESPVHHPVIPTLPAHAADEEAQKIHQIYPQAVLLDVAYSPWPSKLAHLWERHGGRVVSGLEMLLYQALDQVRVFTGRRIDQRLPQELEVLNAMCAAINLAPRQELPNIVCSTDARIYTQNQIIR